MNRTITLTTLLLLALAGCGTGERSNQDIITVDVEKNYPEKKIRLQDAFDVEYVPLETNDEFITKAIVKAVSEHYIVTTNWGDDGDIFLFDRETGEGIRKLNRKGQSGEEYLMPTDCVIDEAKGELFVLDYQRRTILVYDLEGNFKRSLESPSENLYFDNLANFDDSRLIADTKVDLHQGIALLSKQNGSVTREFWTPASQELTPVITEGEYTVVPQYYTIFQAKEGWELVNPSSDTIFHYTPAAGTRPSVVRAPALRSMDTEIFLTPAAITNRYYFMRSMTKRLDTQTFKIPGEDLAYDRQTGELFRCKLYNDDFTDKRVVSLLASPLEYPVALALSLEAPDLVEAYRSDKLRGELKEIAATLDEEANAVIMILNHKRSEL